MMAAAQRVALQLPPRRAVKTVKIARISRAEGGQLQAPVGPHGLLGEWLQSGTVRVSCSR